MAYESQLKSDRAQLHRRLAASIQELDTESADENAALIAEHLETAGDLQAAYGWHMRAATWATNRDIGAARLSWERAQEIADALPTNHPNRAAMRIAPRALLCAHAYRLHVNISGGRFEELRQLCAEAGDKASLAIGMAGLVTEHLKPRPHAGGVAAGLRNHGAGRVGRQSHLDSPAVLRCHHEASNRRDRRGAALVADRHRSGWRRPARAGSLSYRRSRPRWHCAASPDAPLGVP